MAVELLLLPLAQSGQLKELLNGMGRILIDNYGLAYYLCDIVGS
jgi:hypothetical protein